MFYLMTTPYSNLPNDWVHKQHTYQDRITFGQYLKLSLLVKSIPNLNLKIKVIITTTHLSSLNTNFISSVVLYLKIAYPAHIKETLSNIVVVDMSLFIKNSRSKSFRDVIYNNH